MAGVLDVETILRRPARWFREWEIYYELEPFGEIRSDYRAAQIVQMIANVNRGKNQKPYKLQDFLLQFEAQEKKQTPGQMFQMLSMYARAVNAAETEALARAQAAMR